MILVTYGFHRSDRPNNEGVAWLIGYVLHHSNKDKDIIFHDLSVYEKREEWDLMKNISEICKESESKGNKIDAIIDIHVAKSMFVDELEYDPGDSSFYLQVREELDYTKKIVNFLNDVKAWSGELETYSAFPGRSDKHIVKLPSQDFQKKYLGSYGDQYLTLENFFKVDKRAEELEEKLIKAEKEMRKLSDIEKVERWPELLEIEMDQLMEMPDQAKDLDQNINDIRKMLQLLKKYVS